MTGFHKTRPLNARSGSSASQLRLQHCILCYINGLTGCLAPRAKVQRRGIIPLQKRMQNSCHVSKTRARATLRGKDEPNGIGR